MAQRAIGSIVFGIGMLMLARALGTAMVDWISAGHDQINITPDDGDVEVLVRTDTVVPVEDTVDMVVPVDDRVTILVG